MSDANASHVRARSDHIFLASGVSDVCAIRTQSSACWRQSLGWIRMTVVSTSPIQGEVGKSGPFVTEGPLSLRQRLARGATRTNTKHKPPDRGQELVSTSTPTPINGSVISQAEGEGALVAHCPANKTEAWILLATS